MTELTQIYPFNLANGIFQDEDDAREISIPGISAAVATLTEREQSVLMLRFQQKKTLEQCGKEFGVTRERIRQIEAKALRKLRHPSRVNMMKAVPLTELQAQHSEYNKLEKEYEWLKKAFESFTAQKAEPGVIIPMVKRAESLDTPIENLDLSVRSFNCLKRAGKNTLRAVADMSAYDVKQVRNLGRKSVLEVRDKLMEYGIEVKWEV